jgi:Septum formation
MLSKRSVAFAVSVVVLALALAGCSLLPTSTATPSPAAAAKPAIGLCWNATIKQADEWAEWKGDAARACTASHTLYTYQIGTITGETSSTWAASGDPSSLSAGVQAKAEDACNITKLLPHQKWNQQLIQQYFFVPTEAQWKAGARWVRCDVGTLAIGTTIANESFSALPSNISTFVDSVGSDPARYEFCLNSDQSVTDVGPLDNPQATIADCSKSPQWTLATHANLPGAAGAPFPTDAVANAESTAICSPAATGDGQIWIAYLPTKAGWASGDRDVDCWVGQKELTGGQIA